MFKTFIERAAQTLKPQSFQPVQKILDFSRPNEIAKIVSGSDQDIGGFSSVNFHINRTPTISSASSSSFALDDNTSEPQTYGSFQGYLNLDPPSDRPDVRYSGYAMFRTTNLPLNLFRQETYYDWSGLSHLILKVRGDHRKYFVNIQAHSTFVTDLYQHRLFLQTPGKWETVVIPLRDFVLTNKGVIQHQVDMDLARVKTFGIGLIDAQYGPYQLDLAEVSVIRGERVPGYVEKKEYISEKEPDLFLRG